MVFLTARGGLIKKPRAADLGRGCSLSRRCHIKLHPPGPTAGIARDGRRASRGLSLPFVLTASPPASLRRLTPVLVNGMKYSEIDIILLKVSLCVIIFVLVG